MSDRGRDEVIERIEGGLESIDMLVNNASLTGQPALRRFGIAQYNS